MMSRLFFCTSMPLTNATSAHAKSESISGRTFVSTKRFRQWGGNRAAIVSNPKGGYAERLP